MARGGVKAKREYELDIVDLSHDGRGVARVEGKTVFVSGALPGERVRAQQTGRNRHFDEARTLDAACLVLDEIRQRFAEIHYPAQPEDLWCTFSAGVVELFESSDSLMMASLADEALYRAKGGGRNRVQAART